MTLEMLSKEMIAAMKNKDRFRKDAISVLIGAAKKVAIDRGCRDDVPESIVIEVILKEQKTLNEMIDSCPEDRPEKLAEYKARAAIVAEFAPAMMTEDEIAMELDAYCVFKGLEPTKANRGAIMKGFMPTIKGRADGKLANKVITEMLV